MANDVHGAKKPFDRKKFKALVHYVIWKCPDPAKLGAVKLHKILWKSDAAHYLLHGESITGARYVKREWGPTAQALLPVRDELAKEGKIRYWRDRKFAGDWPKDVYEAKALPPKDVLSREQQSIVDYWVQHICMEHTAASISEETHGYAWEIAEMGEDLPIYAALVDRIEEPTEKEIERLKKRAEELGLL